mmetsp:Transcript_74307/g.227345  ORF Transcript_74307/g.227345 Transcript_74307/m.227345 type:complete len:260 (-) Transcript_74307:87-866(-)
MRRRTRAASRGRASARCPRRRACGGRRSGTAAGTTSRRAPRARPRAWRTHRRGAARQRAGPCARTGRGTTGPRRTAATPRARAPSASPASSPPRRSARGQRPATSSAPRRRRRAGPGRARATGAGPRTRARAAPGGPSSSSSPARGAGWPVRSRAGAPRATTQRRKTNSGPAFPRGWRRGGTPAANKFRGPLPMRWPRARAGAAAPPAGTAATPGRTNPSWRSRSRRASVRQSASRSAAAFPRGRRARPPRRPSDPPGA